MSTLFLDHSKSIVWIICHAVHCLTRVPSEALMNEVNHQLKKLNNEAKKGDVAAETTGHNLTWLKLRTSHVTVQCSLYTYMITHVNTHKKHTHHRTAFSSWLTTHPNLYDPNLGLCSSLLILPASSALVITEGLQGLKVHRETGPPNVSFLGNFTQKCTSSIRFPLPHSLLWFQTDPNDVKPGLECVWRSYRMKLNVRRGVNYHRFVHLFPAVVAFEIFYYSFRFQSLSSPLLSSSF